MGKSSNICLSCGFCCEGVLIGFVQLDKEELPVMRALKDIEEFENSGLFFQPCANLDADGCNIYSQRPRQCDLFKCEILKAIENKSLDFDSALEVIYLVKQKKLAIEKQLTSLPFKLQSRSFYFKMVEMQNFMQKANSKSSLQQSHGQLLSEIDELNTLVSKTFGISFY
ncbi:MAG: YkgJ family cysteine cluster protein [Bacteroidales bacterium]